MCCFTDLIVDSRVKDWQDTSSSSKVVVSTKETLLDGPKNRSVELLRTNDRFRVFARVHLIAAFSSRSPAGESCGMWLLSRADSCAGTEPDEVPLVLDEGSRANVHWLWQPPGYAHTERDPRSPLQQAFKLVHGSNSRARPN